MHLRQHRIYCMDSIQLNITGHMTSKVNIRIFRTKKKIQLSTSLKKIRTTSLIDEAPSFWC